MGLDTSHDAWHGSYGAFTRWRNAVAVAAGYEVMEGGVIRHSDGRSDLLHDTVLIDWGHVQDKNYSGDWDEPPADPLIVLIAHSDCDGVIHPEHAGPLADRLAELLPLMAEDQSGHIWSYRGVTEQFIKGLREAVAAGEDVDFH